MRKSMGMGVAAALAGVVVFATAGQNTAVNATRQKQVSALKELKATSEWNSLAAQLDQYTNHLAQFMASRADATSKIAAVPDEATRQALNKMQNEIEKLRQMIDDVYDAARKEKRVVTDAVSILEAR